MKKIILVYYKYLQIFVTNAGVCVMDIINNKPTIN